MAARICRLMKTRKRGVLSKYTLHTVEYITPSSVCIRLFKVLVKRKLSLSYFKEHLK